MTYSFAVDFQDALGNVPAGKGRVHIQAELPGEFHNLASMLHLPVPSRHDMRHFFAAVLTTIDLNSGAVDGSNAILDLAKV